MQRVKNASVKVKGKTVSRIDRGVCLLVGIEKGDSVEDAGYLAKKVVELRIFPDNEGKMNLSLIDIQGEILAVSQFTLAGTVKKGRRPSFDKAEVPERAERIFEHLVSQMQNMGFTVKVGVFGAMMDVNLTNDGPVTFIIPSRQAN